MEMADKLRENAGVHFPGAPDAMADENLKALKDWLCALKVLAGEKRIFYELSATDFMEKLSGLLQSLDHDWTGKCDDLQRTFSYFIINSRYTKEEMLFVSTTTVKWLALVVNIVQYADFIRNLNYLLEQAMKELKETENERVPDK